MAHVSLFSRGRWSPRFVQPNRRNANTSTVWESTDVAMGYLKRCYLSFYQSVPGCLGYSQSPALELPFQAAASIFRRTKFAGGKRPRDSDARLEDGTQIGVQPWNLYPFST